jgi:hypothetical protein
MTEEVVFGSAMTLQGRRLEFVHEPDSLAQQWWLCCAFDGGGVSWLLQWSRLVLVDDT